MINVSVRYPLRDGARFDMTYYTAEHIPLCQQRYGSALKATTVLEPIAEPDTVPENAAAVHFVFDSAAEFNRVMQLHGKELVADVARFTDIEPVIEVSRIR